MISLTNSQIWELMGQFLLAGTGTLSFAILFACPRRSLPTCALVGAVGWFVYELCVMLGLGTAAASLLAVIPLTILTRVFAILQKTPVTVFLLSGIFPLVPGAGIYYTAYYSGRQRTGVVQRHQHLQGRSGTGRGHLAGAQHPAAAAPSLRLTEGPISYQKTSL